MIARDTRVSTDVVLKNRGPFMDEEYTAQFGTTELANAKVLVVGAGGLGCEILKDLALSSFTDIECIDMDTIELSNLNRQFLFREKDVGQSKAEVAVKFIRNIVPGIKITAHFNKIQDFDADFYRQFTIIVCGLDNMLARRWINKMVVDIAYEYGQYIPMIDGGTEGFQGSVKLIIPTITACLECYMKLVPKQTTYPLCTLASSPRLPEHCIEWAHRLEWPKVYPNITFDADDPDHLQKMYQLSAQRAKEFGIKGVTKAKTLGVVKNIIPAIASTNAIIAASCCNEAFKFITSCNPNLKDSMYYNGKVGVVLADDEYDKLPDCPVCGNAIKEVLIDETDIDVKEFAEKYVKQRFSLAAPDLFYGKEDIYNFKDGSKEMTLKGAKSLFKVLPFHKDEEGTMRCDEIIAVVDKNVTPSLKLKIGFNTK